MRMSGSRGTRSTRRTSSRFIITMRMRRSRGISGSFRERAALLKSNSADFNGDGDLGTDADIEAFFACLSGNCCAGCGSAEFNGDGDIGTELDIEAQRAGRGGVLRTGLKPL